MRSALPVLVAALAVSAVALPASELPKLTSAWRDRDVTIDGVDEEWRDLAQPVKGQHFSVGFLNDADALYFCLLSKDQTMVRQVSRVGLILWLDHAGAKKRTFGVRFPTASGPPERNRPRTSGAEGGSAPASREPVAGAGDIEVLLGTGRNDVREIQNGSSGLAARYRVTGDLLVYELRVPLRKGGETQFAVDADPGASLRVELQTPEWRGPVPMRRGMPAIGIGVGRPGGGAFYPGADMAVLKPLDIAADLRLATQPSR